jgi:cutinase
VLSAAVSLVMAPALSDRTVAGIPSASAAPCPDIEVVFARGHEETPGLGLVGQAFVDALKTRTGRDVESYGVVYPAEMDPAPGIGDMTRQINSMVANCPGTRVVVGGYSLGAAVAYGVLNGSLPPGTDQHIPAVVTFGNASRLVGVPTGLPPQYSDQSLDLCNPGDPICSGGPFAPSHLQVAYIAGGPVSTAVDFAADRL